MWCNHTARNMPSADKWCFSCCGLTDSCIVEDHMEFVFLLLSSSLMSVVLCVITVYVFLHTVWRLVVDLFEEFCRWHGTDFSLSFFFSWLVGHEGRICQESYPPATEGHSGSEKKRAQSYSGAILHTVITLKMYFRHFYHKQLTTIQSKHRSVKAANQHYCLLV